MRLPLLAAVSLVIAATAATGCMSEVTSSSRSYLSVEQSGAATTHAPLDAAREVTRLFEVRGFALADQHAVYGGGYALKLTKGNRGLAATKGDDQYVGGADVGSVFYAWIMPTTDGSLVTMVGKPTLNGAEPCSPATPQLLCSGVSSNPDFASAYLSGRAEADLVHGVLAELNLEGFATGPLPASAALIPASETPAPDPACVAAREARLASAAKISDAQARGVMMAAAPECAPVVPVTPSAPAASAPAPDQTANRQ